MDIFLSYSWSCSELADKLENTLAMEPAFHILRDIHAVEVAESLHCFMNSIREAFCSILLINEAYLQSRNCINELVALSKERDFTRQLIPVIIQGTDIFTKQGKDRAIRFWEGIRDETLPFETSELSRALEVVGDLKCIVYNQKEDIDANHCGQAVMDTLIQRVFDHELRPAPITIHRFPLPERRLLCIDFGTSYTLACTIGTDGHSYIVRDCRGEASFPSAIELHSDGSYAVGNAVNTLIPNSNTYVVRALKRVILGAGSVTYGPYHFSTMLLIAMLFHSVKRNAEEFFGVSFNETLLSVPVEFRGHETKLLESAAQVAGLTVVRAIQESSTASLLTTAHAATLGYSYLLNIDLGGGTLDISAAEVSDGVCEILFSLGNRSFGSMDYDHMVCQYAVSRLEREYHLAPIYSDSTLYACILAQVEQIKIELSRCNHTRFSLQAANQMGDMVIYTWDMTRDTYAEITHELTDQLKSILEHTKKLLKESIVGDEKFLIYLTGQGSKLFIIPQLIQETFLGTPIIDDYQESAVCQGLAQQSGILSGVIKELLLLDNLHSYIDIFCDHRNEKKDIIYFGTDNHSLYRLIDPRKGEHGQPCITIPFKQTFRILLTHQAMLEGCDIVLFDSHPTNANDSSTPVYSLRVPAQEPPGIKILEIDVDANGVISAAIYTDKEYAQKHRLDIERDTIRLKQLQQEN